MRSSLSSGRTHEQTPLGEEGQTYRNAVPDPSGSTAPELFYNREWVGQNPLVKSSFKYSDASFSLGPFLKCPYPEMVESCALAGFDFAIADMEHTPLSPREILPLLLAAQNRGMDLIVRIPENQPMYFKWCLDLGVKFIQVPHIQSKADALKAIEASRFSPSGERGLCRFVRAANYSETPVQDYIENANERSRLILQIEGARGLDSIDEILSVEGIDTIFIGPYDLSQSLGHPGQIHHPAVVGAMNRIVEACSKAGVRVGTFADSPEGIQRWVSKGVQMIEFASDLNLFLGGAKALRAGLSEGQPR